MTTLPTIPTLHTARLTLRAPDARDLEPFAAFYASGAAKYVGGPQTKAETWRYLCQVIGHWSVRGYGRWMVTLKCDDTAIGLVGLHNPFDWPEPEVGWYIWSGLGQGYASEAGRAARQFAYETLGWTTLISMISPWNAASVGVAQSMGATRDPDHSLPHSGTVMVYRHPGPEALQ